jgi:menaquinol-cytochrome c reductase iron-sulfur subunit
MTSSHTSPHSDKEPAVGNTHCTVIIDDQAKRRNVVYAILATIIGGLVGVFPFLSGLALFLDPAIKKRNQVEPTAGPTFRRVASLATVPADGTPVQVPVIADLKDIWTVEPNQPVGAVYLRNTGRIDPTTKLPVIECFNAICPHAGCFVAYAVDRKCYQCPCHTSSFTTDGARIMPSPSPRNMDPLKVEVRVDNSNQEVWVAFVNYYPGKEHMEAKPA